nr:unnamed protein product [Callosobruchus chinensis]
MPSFTTNYSPFTIRVRPVRRREETSNKSATMKNPSVSGQSSTCSTASSTSSGSDNEESSKDEESSYTNEISSSKESSPEPVTFRSLFPTMKEVYGTELKSPSEADILTYKKYVLMGKRANGRLTSIPFLPVGTASGMKCLKNLPKIQCTV